MLRKQRLRSEARTHVAQLVVPVGSPCFSEPFALRRQPMSAYGYNLPSEPPPHHVRSYSSFGPLSANVWNLVVFVRSALRSGHDGCQSLTGTIDPLRTLGIIKHRFWYDLLEHDSEYLRRASEPRQSDRVHLMTFSPD